MSTETKGDTTSKRKQRLEASNETRGRHPNTPRAGPTLPPPLTISCDSVALVSRRPLVALCTCAKATFCCFLAASSAAPSLPRMGMKGGVSWA